MMVVLLVAGIGFLLAGLVAIGFGIPINEFGFGNTLILAGTIAACTGMLLLGFWTAVKELKTIARRLGPAGLHAGAALEAAPGASSRASESGFLFSRDQPAAEGAGIAEPAAPSPGGAPVPWQEEAAPRNLASADAPAVPAPAEAKQRRNLLFSSTSRKERERAQARTSEPLSPDLPSPDLRPAPPVPPPASEASVPPPATFDDAWPKPERPRAAAAPPRRSGRTPSTFAEPGAAADRSPPAARNDDQPPVTVLKSGVVDGMAYSLYSDGSIEAQMPEGMMRFASIDELRSHLDHRQ
ncbi:DUF308 domain-containing protein [Bradyrhizobium sediminis]|uniref:DUF308 domain-containing protein n=1 Tax=Bradyrhizobium sediminis TaxID=2840469 RepID=A0A975RKS9_9BRAD|nr:DUF308 domain-containing protein [Bradyrhizobium sediminis]QWG11685.1 DUF308 domain-containing protein [Bradyrhizobium sediminis]